MLISQDDVIAMHKKYAPSAAVYDLVYTHCLIVRDIALQLIINSSLEVDRELVEIGAMLHDIGVYPLFKTNGRLREGVQYITHGIEGERILRQEGLPESVWRFAAHHTGVGLTKQDIIDQNLALPAADYLAKTDEERLIMFADKFHSKTTPPFFNSYAWYRSDVAKFGTDKVTMFEQLAVLFGQPDLRLLQAKYPFEIR